MVPKALRPKYRTHGSRFFHICYYFIHKLQGDSSDCMTSKRHDLPIVHKTTMKATQKLVAFICYKR